MNTNLDKYPVTKQLVENEGAIIKVDSSGRLGEQMDYRLYLRSKAGKELATSYSKSSIEKCLNNIEKSVREKLNEDYDKSKPFEMLMKEIRRINLLQTRTYGSDKVGGFSLPSFNFGVSNDEEGNLVTAPTEIRVGNAANPVIQFDALQKSDWIDVNAGWVKHHLTGHEAIVDVIKAVDRYLYTDVEVRKAELTEAMDKNGWRFP